MQHLWLENHLQGYGQSKTAVNLFSLELDTRAKAHNVRSYSFDKFPFFCEFI